MGLGRSPALFLALVFLPMCGGPAGGQESSAIPNTHSTTSAKPPGNENNDASEPYVFDLIQKRVVFEADGKGYRDFVARVHIKSESAVREFGLLTYPFASSFESLEVIYARVRKPDGSVVETPASDIQELDSGVSREAPMYTDQREKHIAIKSLSAGDVLELHVRWTIHDPIAPEHFWFDHNFFREGVCLKEILEIDVPRNLPVQLRNSDPQPSVRDDAARRVYTFENVNQRHPASGCSSLFLFFLERSRRLVRRYGKAKGRRIRRNPLQGGRAHQEQDNRRREDTSALRVRIIAFSLYRDRSWSQPLHSAFRSGGYGQSIWRLQGQTYPFRRAAKSRQRSRLPRSDQLGLPY